MVSHAAHSVWAKSDRDRDGWLSLLDHLKDAQGVAGMLWDEFLPNQVIATISQGLPDGVVDGRLLVRWLAGVHDIGKATPAFAAQVEPLAQRMRDAGLPIHPRVIRDPDRRTLPHSVAGQLLLTDWLAGFGSSANVARTYSVVVGGHHGVPPGASSLRLPSSQLIGGGTWLQVQKEILDLMADGVGVRDRLACWMTKPLAYPAQVLVSAVVILADWIASNPEFFPYRSSSSAQAAPGSRSVEAPGTSRLEAAWVSLGLLRPWRPEPYVGDDDSFFLDRFDLPAGDRPRPIQRAALESARAASVAPLMIVEARMGEGKTEAALAAAEVLAQRFGSGGVFFALPTMATSNAMFGRVGDWIQHLPSNIESAEQPLFLAHGKAALNQEFSDLPRDVSWGERLDGIDPDGDIAAERNAKVVAVAHSWLRGRKKGVLSAFVVGTIDQLLFSALRSRHLALRHLAFAGKVVIVDEVHAVDIYMGSYLAMAVEWLGAYRVPTILLSATLTPSHRGELIEAYERGRSAAGGTSPVEHTVITAGGYPCVTSSAGTAPVTLCPGGSGRRQEIVIAALGDDDAVLVATLREALGDGGCVGIVRNTVRRAQDTAELLRREFDCEVILAHSRFVSPHRAQREEQLRFRLGPPGRAGVERPHRLIVVGTQVIEQSLDIDLDLLITDLAPTDLLLQRIGRLHRHSRGAGESDRPAPLRRARCLITGVKDWSTTPPEPVSGSLAVYGRSTLLRALVVLQPLLSGAPLVLPDDIPDLVERAYRPDLQAPVGWEKTMVDADDEQNRRNSRQLDKSSAFRLGPVKSAGSSLVGWVSQSVGESEDEGSGQAQVRDTDPSVEVVVTVRVDGEVHRLDETGGCGPIIATMHLPGWFEAKQAAACTVRLPISVTNPGVIDRVLQSLETTHYPGWQESPWLAGQLVLELDENWSAELGDYRFTYDQQLGLVDVRVRPRGQADG